VADAELAAGEGVDGGAVGGAVVAEHAFDADAVAAREADGAGEEAGGGRCCLVGEDFGVGESAVIVDGDVEVLPADAVAAAAGGVGVSGVVVLAQTVTPAFAPRRP
jgi:hypothetical protein